MKIKVKATVIPARPQTFVYIELTEEEAYELGAELADIDLGWDQESTPCIDDLLTILSERGFAG
jgi:hypothetical protein